MKEHTLQLAAQAINEADAIFITAGAGMGVDSGLPDFRGDTGFWKAYPLLKEEGLGFIDLANPEWFHKDPRRAWGFYGHRFNLYSKTIPHEGFHILQKWAESKMVSPFVYTSNVDGHFQKAGFDADSVIECHGSINHLQCLEGCCGDIWSLKELTATINEERLTAEGELPRCPHCGALARPNILMFGDADWLPERSAKQENRYVAWKHERKVDGHKVVSIELGAGTAIPTARYAAESMPGTLIRINPRDWQGEAGILSLASGALSALQAIDHLLS